MTINLLDDNIYALREVYIARKILNLEDNCENTKLELNLSLYQLEDQSEQ